MDDGHLILSGKSVDGENRLWEVCERQNWFSSLGTWTQKKIIKVFGLCNWMDEGFILREQNGEDSQLWEKSHEVSFEQVELEE